MIDMRPFARPFIVMGIYVLLINVYSSLNAVWLGFVTNTDEVGYYTTATKLHTIIMAVLSSFSNILFPRMSHLLAEGKEKEYWEKIRISLDAVFLFAFPTIVFMLSCGPQLLHLVVGDGFEGAYLPLRINVPLILIIGIEQIFVIQILLAMHQDNTVLKNCFLGAVVSVVFNVMLTANLGAPGSAIVWVAAESSIMCLSIAAVYKKYSFVFPYRRVATYCVAYLPLLISAVILQYALENNYVAMIATGALTIVYAALIEQYVLKNAVAQQVIQAIRSRLTRF